MVTDNSLQIGALIFPRMDQMDFTGPFEVLSLLPNSTFHIIWKEKTPLPDARGLILTPTATMAETPPLDLLVVPGGRGQQALMEDDEVLEFLQRQSRNARYVLSVCTGALLCGAAGLLRGVRATTHWNSIQLLEYFGAIAVNERVVIDGRHVSAAGVSSGIDGALRVAQLLAGDRVAQIIQLTLQYAPEPPFTGGTPETAPPEILEACRAAVREITAARVATAQKFAQKRSGERR